MSAWRAYRSRLQGIEDRFAEVVFRRNRPGRLSNHGLVAAVLESQWQRMNVSKHIAAFDRALGRSVGWTEGYGGGLTVSFPTTVYVMNEAGATVGKYVVLGDQA